MPVGTCKSPLKLKLLGFVRLKRPATEGCEWKKYICKGKHGVGQCHKGEGRNVCFCCQDNTAIS